MGIYNADLWTSGKIRKIGKLSTVSKSFPFKSISRIRFFPLTNRKSEPKDDVVFRARRHVDGKGELPRELLGYHLPSTPHLQMIGNQCSNEPQDTFVPSPHEASPPFQLAHKLQERYGRFYGRRLHCQLKKLVEEKRFLELKENDEILAVIEYYFKSALSVYSFKSTQLILDDNAKRIETSTYQCFSLKSMNFSYC